VERPGRCLAVARQPSRASVRCAPCTRQAFRGGATPPGLCQASLGRMARRRFSGRRSIILVPQLPFSRTLRQVEERALAGRTHLEAVPGFQASSRGSYHPRAGAQCVATGDPTSRAAAVLPRGDTARLRGATSAAVARLARGLPPVVAARSSVLERGAAASPPTAS